MFCPYLPVPLVLLYCQHFIGIFYFFQIYVIFFSFYFLGTESTDFQYSDIHLKIKFSLNTDLSACPLFPDVFQILSCRLCLYQWIQPCVAAAMPGSICLHSGAGNSFVLHSVTISNNCNPPLLLHVVICYVSVIHDSSQKSLVSAVPSFCLQHIFEYFSHACILCQSSCSSAYLHVAVTLLICLHH